MSGAALAAHPLPARITTLADLRLFMEHHVFAVWDFMQLLKALQQHLAPSGGPWLPSAQPRWAGLITTLVAEEECDHLPAALGGPCAISHFAIYRRAMLEIGADTGPIDAALALAAQQGMAAALRHRAIPEPARRFMAQTQALIAAGDPHQLAAAFAYGRELLVPDLFRALRDRLHQRQLPAPLLLWYLERHISLDGDCHGPLAEQLVQDLGHGDPARQRRAAAVARRVVRERERFWQAIHDRLPAPSAAC